MLNKIKARDGIRTEIIESIQKKRTYINKDEFTTITLIMISESIDDYIGHRITTDKTIEGILRDIQNNTGRIAEEAEKGF